jgi:hypothetical protein
MKNAVFWDIRTKFILKRRHYFSTTESSRLMLCKIWGFSGGDFEECRLLGYKTRVRTSQETHYFSATEPSQLMLCKIWGFHGGVYEEWRFLEYKNPVRTSEETHYVSARMLSQLMLCKIWGFHGGGYEGCRPLGCDAVVRTKVSEEHIASIIKATRIGELGTTLTATSNRSTLRCNVRRFLPPW